MNRRDSPRVSRYCTCGAQWHGRYALPESNSVLAFHTSRCGPPVSEDAFVDLGHRVRQPLSWRTADRRESER